MRRRDQLLARARLAGDEHRRVGRRDLLDHLVDFRRIAGLLPMMSPNVPCSRSCRRSTATSRSVSRRSTILSSRIFSRCMSTGL